MATLNTLIAQINKMEAEIEKLKKENSSIKKQMTTEKINKMICDKISNIKQIDNKSDTNIKQEIERHVNEKFITNLYRNK